MSDLDVLAVGSRTLRSPSVSSEVDVAREAGLASPFQQEEQRGPFRRPSPASDNDDDPVMWLSLRQFDEIVTVARRQETIVFLRKLQDSRIGGLRRKHIAQSQDLVAQLSKQVAEVLRDVVVEQKLHR